MPFVDIRYTKGSLSSAELAAIADRITAVAIAAEGLQDNAVSRSISVVASHPYADVFVGGQCMLDPRFLVTVHAFSEAMDTAVREVLVANIADAFTAESARYREAGARSLWCIVNLLPPATFAVSGSMVTLEQVRQMTNS